MPQARELSGLSLYGFTALINCLFMSSNHADTKNSTNDFVVLYTYVHMSRHVKKDKKAALISCSTLTRCTMGMIKCICNQKVSVQYIYIFQPY